MDRRPNPDFLSEQVQKNEARLRRGRLKIFLGYVSGVGKTYAMLEAALQRLDDDMDVVALVETHGRVETERLLDQLETLPKDDILDDGISPGEIDVDRLLLRRPDLVLLDDLAHTNPPGSRHARRYQDVLELLDSGIDVYTTLNIQHLESLNDVVAQITGVAVHETLPDRVFDDADEIELVDLSIDELLQRLAEGKVHVGERAAQVVHQFYRRGNLSALRELAFRRAADRVDEQMRAYMRTHDIVGPWPAGERVLVCVSPSPLSERLVRAGRRLAARLNAEWFALYVETPGHAGLSEADRDRLAHTLRLAEELGARSIAIPGRSVAEAVTAFARARNVTKIVVGKPEHSRWREWVSGTVVDQIIRHSQDIDVHVVSGRPASDSAKMAIMPASRTPAPWRGYVLSLALVLLATLLALPLRPFIEPTNLVMLYLLAVVVAAIRLGRAPAILASFLSVVAFDIIFVPPYYTLVVSDAEYIMTFAALFMVGVVISTLAARARQQVQAGQRREGHMVVLYELSRDLAGAANVQRVAQTVVRHVEETLGRRAAVLTRQAEQLKLAHGSTGFNLGDDEYAVASWTFEHRTVAGKYTETFSGARGLYLPLKTAQDVVGVLGVAPVDDSDDSGPMTAEQRRLLESFASQAAMAVERSLLAEEARQAHLLQETEKLQTALLNSISHDLRTPLASITGALSSLQYDAVLLSDEARRELIHNAYEEAERLNRLVANLLKMTQLESGALRISKELHDLEDVMGVVLAQLKHRLRNRDVQLDVPEALPLAPMDFVLMAQVLVNLLENAHKYSAPGSPLRIRARAVAEELIIEIMDRGPGIPQAEKDRVFEKFYRLSVIDDMPGTGLGLSISRGIVEAHGGRIWVEDREGGGSIFTVALPLEGLKEPRPELVR